MRNISIRTSRQTSVPIDIVRTTGLGNIRGRLFPATIPTKLFAHRDFRPLAGWRVPAKLAGGLLSCSPFLNIGQYYRAWGCKPCNPGNFYAVLRYNEALTESRVLTSV